MTYCKSVTFVEMFCCICGLTFAFALTGSVSYMVYFHYNTASSLRISDTPDNFGIRSSLRSPPVFKINRSHANSIEQLVDERNGKLRKKYDILETIVRRKPHYIWDLGISKDTTHLRKIPPYQGVSQEVSVLRLMY